MSSLKQLIKQMNELLDELIKNGRELLAAAQQAISEEELAPLQEHQQTLLTQLEKVDQELQQYPPSDIGATMHQQVHDKLQEFQLLNQEFVNALKASHGLIQFDVKGLKEETSEEEFLTALQRLHKISLSPSRPQAIKSKKHKKSR